GGALVGRLAKSALAPRHRRCRRSRRFLGEGNELAAQAAPEFRRRDEITLEPKRVAWAAQDVAGQVFRGAQSAARKPLRILSRSLSGPAAQSNETSFCLRRIRRRILEVPG